MRFIKNIEINIFIKKIIKDVDGGQSDTSRNQKEHRKRKRTKNQMPETETCFKDDDKRYKKNKKISKGRVIKNK